MTKYERFKNMATTFIHDKGPDILCDSTKYIVEKGVDVLYDSAKEASQDNKSFAKTFGDNVASEVVSDIATGIFGSEAIMAYKVASLVAEGVDKTIEFGRAKAKHVAETGVISNGELGNGVFKTSKFAATMRQNQLQNMSSDMQRARAILGSEARKLAINTSY